MLPYLATNQTHDWQVMVLDPIGRLPPSTCGSLGVLGSDFVPHPSPPCCVRQASRRAKLAQFVLLSAVCGGAWVHTRMSLSLSLFVCVTLEILGVIWGVSWTLLFSVYRGEWSTKEVCSENEALLGID